MPASSTPLVTTPRALEASPQFAPAPALPVTPVTPDAPVALSPSVEPAPPAPIESARPSIAEPLREPPEPAPAIVEAAPSPARPRGSAAEMAGVQRTLDRYRQMYVDLDASTAASFWPRADSRALERVFANLSRQELDFDECVIALSDASATAECAGWLRYVPRVGNTQLKSERHSWTIVLQRDAEAWQIVRVNAR